MTREDTLNIALISSGDDANQLITLLQKKKVHIALNIKPSDITKDIIEQTNMNVWLLDIDENDWNNFLDELLDTSSIPVFFNEYGALQKHAHPEHWCSNLVKRLYDISGLTYVSEEEKAAQEKAAQEKAAQEKAAQEKAAQEKAAQEKAAQEKAAQEKAAQEKAAQEKAAQEKAAQEKAAQEKAAQEKAAQEKAAQEKAAQEKAAQEKAAQEKAAQEKAAQEKAAQEKAAQEKATQEKAAQEKAAQEKAAQEKAAQEKAAQEKAAQMLNESNEAMTRLDAATEALENMVDEVSENVMEEFVEELADIDDVLAAYDLAEKEEKAATLSPPPLPTESVHKEGGALSDIDLGINDSDMLLDMDEEKSHELENHNIDDIKPTHTLDFPDENAVEVDELLPDVENELVSLLEDDLLTHNDDSALPQIEVEQVAQNESDELKTEELIEIDDLNEWNQQKIETQELSELPDLLSEEPPMTLNDDMDIPLLEESPTGMSFEALAESGLHEDASSSAPPPVNICVLGASLGGPAAVKRFLLSVSKNVNTAFVLAQHIDDNFLPVLCNILDTQTDFSAKIITEKLRVEPGHIYIAPIQQQIRFDALGNVEPISEAWTPPYSPCIDDVIKAAADVYRRQCLVIIFSGMGDDGKIGASHALPLGAQVWAQSPETCANSSMPDSVIDAELVTQVASPEHLAKNVVSNFNLLEEQVAEDIK